MKMYKSVKAEAAVISTMIMLLVIVILAVFVFSWGQSMVGQSQTGFEAVLSSSLNRTSEELTIELVDFIDGGLKIKVRNTGSVPVTVGAVYINEVYVSITPLKIEPGELTTITVNHQWSQGQTYHIAVSTTYGNSYEIYVKAPAS